MKPAGEGEGGERGRGYHGGNVASSLAIAGKNGEFILHAPRRPAASARHRATVQDTHTHHNLVLILLTQANLLQT